MCGERKWENVCSQWQQRVCRLYSGSKVRGIYEVIKSFLCIELLLLKTKVGYIYEK